MLKTKIQLMELKLHGGCPRSMSQASDEAVASAMQARDTLSTIPSLTFAPANTCGLKPARDRRPLKGKLVQVLGSYLQAMQ
jgi:hypothetical protein